MRARRAVGFALVALSTFTVLLAVFTVGVMVGAANAGGQWP